ncbi:MAG: hypothetical protein P0116_02800 [Candidatus Nitrosocosmicus sp.]|nr:hypothetical protein [Candidatus Nitrosocosmicus sp.]
MRRECSSSRFRCISIIDAWPSVEKTIPSDYDGIKERNSDITHSDKTEYDQKSLH